MVVSVCVFVCVHSIHHTKATNDKNFGGYRFWDWLCGTAMHADEYATVVKRA